MGLRILIPRPRWRHSLGRTHKFMWVALAVAVWGTAYTLLGAGGLVGVMRARSEALELEGRVDESRQTNAALEARIRALKDDPATIEELARERLYLAKPGEKVYLLPPSASAEPPAGENDEAEEPWPAGQLR